MTQESFLWQGRSCLGTTSVEEFLTQYWQKKPLLIKNAFVDLQSPISADELAGLACEERVNSRLVLAKNKGSNQNWQVEFGPFDESRFSQLPETDWSLLVSDIERHCPETQSLVNCFRFIPDWRIDDLMISYAPTGGSVGPHTDAYDVFLLQLSGQRLWKISEHYDKEILSNCDLSILKAFDPEQEWLLSAGDMLYLPPNVAHHGVAQASQDADGNAEHCMTASIGFRAPSLKTITSDYIHHLNENKQDNSRYSDMSPIVPRHHAEISEDTITEFIEYLKQGLSIDREQVRLWLGEYTSDNKAFEDLTCHEPDIDFDELRKAALQSAIKQSPYSNFLFSHTEHSSLLFVDGISYTTDRAFAELLCSKQAIEFSQLEKIMTSPDQITLLTLFNNGSLIID
jgi:50S ribosomal protein L16 3-hydroxylase